jgi:hypothetical protein
MYKMSHKSRATFQKTEKERAKREKRLGKLQKKLERRMEAKQRKFEGDEGGLDTKDSESPVEQIVSES